MVLMKAYYKMIQGLQKDAMKLLKSAKKVATAQNNYFIRDWVNHCFKVNQQYL